MDEINVTDEERFADVCSKLKEGNDLSNDDGLFLLQIIQGLDSAYSINSTVVSYLGRAIPQMTVSLGQAIMQRCGRNDMKSKKSVLKTCEQYVDTLWHNARQEAAAIALANLDTSTEEELSE